MAGKPESKTKKLLHSKPAIAVLLVLIVLVGTLQFQQLRKRQKFNQEIAELQKQEQELIAKNQVLQDSLEYINNDNYKEKIARQQLNLKKEGEVVVNFPAQINFSEQQSAPEPEPTNPQKWWNYFFNN